MSRVPELNKKFDIIRGINQYLGERNMSNGFSICDPGRVLCKEFKKKTLKMRVQPRNWREAAPEFTNKEVGYHPSSRGMKNYVSYVRKYIEHQVFAN